MTTAEKLQRILTSMGDEEQARQLMRFFKTGEGDYGEGDRFIGLRCPQTRAIVKEARLDVPFSEIEKLLHSPWHEIRFAGFQLLVEEMKAALPRKRQTPAPRLLANGSSTPTPTDICPTDTYSTRS